MRQIAKKLFLTAASLLVLLGLAVPMAVGADASTGAAANTGGTIEALKGYCQGLASSKIDSSCKNTTVITGVRNAAEQTTKCVQLTVQQDLAGCIESEGKRIIKEAIQGTKTIKAAKTGQDFENNLKKIYSAENLDPTKQTTESGKGLPEQCSGGDCPANLGSDPDIQCTSGQCDLIAKYVNPTINLLSLCFGVIAAASLIAGGIQYSASVGDPQKVSNAKKRVFNTLLAVVAYLFMYSFLQFLVPGGVFNR